MNICQELGQNNWKLQHFFGWQFLKALQNIEPLRTVCKETTCRGTLLSYSNFIICGAARQISLIWHVFGFAFDVSAVVFLLLLLLLLLMLAFPNSCELYRINKQRASSEWGIQSTPCNATFCGYHAHKPACHMSLIICCNFRVAVNWHFGFCGFGWHGFWQLPTVHCSPATQWKQKMPQGMPTHACQTVESIPESVWYENASVINTKLRK